MERDMHGETSDVGHIGETVADGGERRDGMLSELARKAVASSVSKLVETEGFVREIVKAMSREVAAYIGRELASVRQEVVDQATDKIVGWLDKVDIAGEIRKSLDGMTFDINVKVHVTDEGLKTGPAPVRKPSAAGKPSNARKSSGALKSAHAGKPVAARKAATRK